MNNQNILYGMVLGDGHLDKPSKRRPSSRLTICQGIKQLEYVEHKSKLLSELGFVNVVKIGKVYKNSPLPSVQLRTRVAPEWTEIRAELYSFRNTPDKMRKRITKNILKKCDITTLLYLYLDDGYNKPHKPNKQGRVELYTCDFPYEEQELLRDWIYELTGAEMRIFRKKTQYMLCTYSDAEKFKNAIRPIFPNIKCMDYKLIPSEYLSSQ